MSEEDITRDLFHCCALSAYFEIASETGQWPPDSETVRRRAYQLYERELAQENRNRLRPSEFHATPVQATSGECTCQSASAEEATLQDSS